MNLEQKLINFINDPKIKAFILKYKDFEPYKNFLKVSYDIDSKEISFSVVAKVTTPELVEEFYPEVIKKVEKHLDGILGSSRHRFIFYLGRSINENSKYVKAWFKGDYKPFPELEFVPSHLRASSSTLCGGVTGRCGYLVNQCTFVTASKETPLYFHMKSDLMNTVIEDEFGLNLSNISYNLFSISEDNESRKVVLYEITPETKKYDLLKEKSLEVFDKCKIYEEIFGTPIEDNISFFNTNKVTFGFKNIFNFLVGNYGLF